MLLLFAFGGLSAPFSSVVMLVEESSSCTFSRLPASAALYSAECLSSVFHMRCFVSSSSKTVYLEVDWIIRHVFSWIISIIVAVVAVTVAHISFPFL
jgi:uncharacterized membrane protein